MKNLIYTLVALLSIAAASAQSNKPSTTVSPAQTGTENITGASNTSSVNQQRETFNTVNNTTGTKTTTTASTSTSSRRKTPVNTNNGTNNDGSSTGTSVTGNGAANAGTAINTGNETTVTPRGK